MFQISRGPQLRDATNSMKIANNLVGALRIDRLIFVVDNLPRERFCNCNSQFGPTVQFKKRKPSDRGTSKIVSLVSVMPSVEEQVLFVSILLLYHVVYLSSCCFRNE